MVGGGRVVKQGSRGGWVGRVDQTTQRYMETYREGIYVRKHRKRIKEAI
jgi:hypothetical protein